MEHIKLRVSNQISILWNLTYFTDMLLCAAQHIVINLIVSQMQK